MHFDWRLATYDLLRTQAHAGILNRAGLLTDDELAQVVAAIAELGTDIASRNCQKRLRG